MNDERVKSLSGAVKAKKEENKMGREEAKERVCGMRLVFHVLNRVREEPTPELRLSVGERL